jgi:competence protein ComEA
MQSGKSNSYLYFSKKERMGILALVSLMLLLFVLPNFISSGPSRKDQQSLDQFKKELMTLNIRSSGDSMSRDTKINGADSIRRIAERPIAGNDNSGAVPALFYFDPNRMQEEEWRKLGLTERKILTIKHYLSKGGRFRSAADLGKIYGITESEYKQLAPYVRISKDQVADPSYKSAIREPSRRLQISDSGRIEHARKAMPPAPIDINKADSSQLQSFRGIGRKLASRIINFRDRLGGFYSLPQVAETYGLPDSVYQQISPFLMIQDSSIRKININEADMSTLQQHPYIRWKLARAIVEYRNQHGSFKRIGDLQNLNILGTAEFQKIAPYLKIN